ncbi:MAG: tetratricopeptide repeat protein, partial [Fimbriimonadaceae bacterium]
MTKHRPICIALLFVLFVVQGTIQRAYLFDAWSRYYAPKNVGQTVAPGLDPGQLLVALAGFRELVAGILWVRADSFFDSGNYDAILPMIRLVTWLDPSQIDVYATGMWHIGYNFTDEQSRSDRRYIPQALALGREGARFNDHTYELFFELGWMWYHKIDDDYENAVKWWEEAHKRPDIIPGRRNTLGMAYQRNGQVQEALDLYFRLLEDMQRRVEADESFSNRQIRDTIENNIDTMLVRMAQRGWFAQQRNDGSFETGGYDVNPPFDVGFSARVTVEEPRVIRVEGTWNVRPVGTRVRIVLRDVDFPNAKPAGMIWDSAEAVDLNIPTGWTFMQDQLFVRDRRFNRRIDMSKDLTMYPMKSENYVIEFYYNPRSAPPHIQDKFGWNGEGMTDRNFLNSEVRPGQRVMFTSLTLTRDQLLRREI